MTIGSGWSLTMRNFSEGMNRVAAVVTWNGLWNCWLLEWKDGMIMDKIVAVLVFVVYIRRC